VEEVGEMIRVKHNLKGKILIKQDESEIDMNDSSGDWLARTNDAWEIVTIVEDISEPVTQELNPAEEGPGAESGSLDEASDSTRIPPEEPDKPTEQRVPAIPEPEEEEDRSVGKNTQSHKNLKKSKWR
jgi:hypothetical protein